MALASKELQVLGITCVAGNVELSLTSLNARKICELAGCNEVPIFEGASRPLNRDLVTAKHVHGGTGLDGTNLPNPTLQSSKLHAVDFMIETIMSNEKNEVTLCALGPLTNIALALQKEPKIAGRLRQVVFMGGGFFEGGNITPAAEFNIFVDPEAASEVLASRIPLIMMPLDLTHKVLTSPKLIDELKSLGNRTGQVTAELLDFFGRYDSKKYGSEGAPLHDPNVIVYLLKPEIYAGKLVNVEVEKKSSLTMGMTVADWWEVTDREKNVVFVKDVKVEEVLNLIVQRLSILP